MTFETLTVSVVPYWPAPLALASTVEPFEPYTVSLGASRLRPLLWTSSSSVLAAPDGAVNEKYSDCPAVVMSRFGTSAVEVRRADGRGRAQSAIRSAVRVVRVRRARTVGAVDAADARDVVAGQAGLPAGVRRVFDGA